MDDDFLQFGLGQAVGIGKRRGGGKLRAAGRFKRDRGADYGVARGIAQSDAQREQVLRKFAKDGFSPIMTVGFAWETALTKIAPEYPKTKFGIIDDVVDLPNVQSVVFKEHEGSFVVGVIAADTSKTGKVGFVGGMDIPLISKFECGYAQGVKYGSDGKAEVFANMTGTTPAAWNDPVKGGELAKSQMDRGADIIYAAAGATGQGVLKAAATARSSRLPTVGARAERSPRAIEPAALLSCRSGLAIDCASISAA